MSDCVYDSPVLVILRKSFIRDIRLYAGYQREYNQALEPAMGRWAKGMRDHAIMALRRLHSTCQYHAAYHRQLSSSAAAAPADPALTTAA